MIVEISFADFLLGTFLIFQSMLSGVGLHYAIRRKKGKTLKGGIPTANSQEPNPDLNCSLKLTIGDLTEIRS